MTVQEWIHACECAWRDRDAGAVPLVTEVCLHRSHPTAKGHRGRGGVRAYRGDVSSTQETPDVPVGEPIVSVLPSSSGCRCRTAVSTCR
jgi:hypothetical protein